MMRRVRAVQRIKNANIMMKGSVNTYKPFVLNCTEVTSPIQNHSLLLANKMQTRHYSRTTLKEKPKVIILGATGSFGRLFMERAASKDNIQLIPTSRSKSSLTHILRDLNITEKQRDSLLANFESTDSINLQTLSQDLKKKNIKVSPSLIEKEGEEREKLKQQQVDAERQFQEKKRKTKEALQSLLKKADIVVNCVGPFNDLEYELINECIKYKCHYIDLADTREYVAKTHSTLDSTASAAGVTIVTGASTVPSITEAIVAKYEKEFAMITDINTYISPGNKAIRGLGTIQSVTAYAGKKISILKKGVMERVSGWSENERKAFPGFWSKRPVAIVDVPDHDLFSKRFPDLQNLNVKAGVEMNIIQYPFLFCAWLVKNKIIKSSTLMKLTPMMYHIANLFKYFGGDRGLLHMDIEGIDKHGNPHVVSDSLIARSAHGPYIPVIPALITLERLVEGKLEKGAYPCMSIFSYDEFKSAVSDLDIFNIVDGVSSKASNALPNSDTLSRPHRPIWSQMVGRDNWKALPDYVQHFHAPKHVAISEGSFTVTRHSNFIVQKLLDIVGLPKEQKVKKCRVSADSNNLWIRKFEETPQKMSSQWLPHNGVGLENFPFAQFGFDIVPQQNLTYYNANGIPDMVKRDMEQHQTTDMKNSQLGFKHESIVAYYYVPRYPKIHIKVPEILQMTANGCTMPLPHRNGWYVDVRVVAPLIGEMVRYEGIITVEGEYDVLVDENNVKGANYRESF